MGNILSVYGDGNAFTQPDIVASLAYVLDAGSVDGRDPLDDFASLQRELDLYCDGLSQRPAIVIANKNDEPAAAENLERIREATGLPTFSTCAELEEGIEAVIAKLRDMVKPQPPV